MRENIDGNRRCGVVPNVVLVVVVSSVGPIGYRWLQATISWYVWLIKVTGLGTQGLATHSLALLYLTGRGPLKIMLGEPSKCPYYGIGQK